MQVTERRQSEFNDAVGYLGRLNSLFYLADDASINFDIHKWFSALLAIFRELSTEMNDTELAYGKGVINDINPKVNKASKEFNRTGKLAVDNQLYMNLNDFEIWLRKIMKSAGLLMKMQEDASKALI